MPDPRRETPPPVERAPDPGRERRPPIGDRPGDTPVELPPDPERERQRRPPGDDRPGDTPVELPPRDPDPNRDDPSKRLVHPEDEDRKVRTDQGEKRPFGVMP